MVRSGYDVILAKGLPGNAGRRVAVALSLALAIVLVVAAPLLVAS